jgi:hypothetical protein
MARFSQAGRDKANAQRTIPLDRYKEEGCDDRAEYLEGLAEENGVALRMVWELAQLLGAEEDFDGLVTSLEDQAALMDF